MKIESHFVIYEFSQPDAEGFMLRKVNFGGWKANRFYSEQEAIQALVEDDRV